MCVCCDRMGYMCVCVCVSVRAHVYATVGVACLCLCGYMFGWRDGLPLSEISRRLEMSQSLLLRVKPPMNLAKPPTAPTSPHVH